MWLPFLALALCGLSILLLDPPAAIAESLRPQERRHNALRSGLEETQREAPPANPNGVVQVQIDAGIGGVFARGRSLPVVITVRSDRALAATSSVEIDQFEIFVLRRDINVAAGAVESLTMVLPTDDRSTFIDLSVSIRSDDGVVLATDTATVRADDTVELVGVLPNLAREADPPDTAPLVVDVGTARLHRVDLALFAEGRRGLEIFDVIAATAGDLDGLTEAELASLKRWVIGGGALLVDEPVDRPPVRLTDDWSFGPRGHVAVGRGEVMLTRGRLSTGAWSQFVLPQPTSNRFDEADLGAFFVSFVESPETTLARDAQLTLPGVGLLVGGALLYTIAIAVTYARLGRSRRHLTWIIVPTYAVVVTCAVLAVGWRIRGESRAVHATIRETSTVGGWATTRVLTVTNNRLAEVGLPLGWGAAGDVLAGSARSFEEVDRLAVQLAPGAIGATVVEGPTGREELAVEVRSTDSGSVAGRVTNNTPWDLVQIAVFATQQVLPVGDLAPGESIEFELSDLNDFALFRDREGLAWGIPDGTGDPTLKSSDPSGVRNDGAWREFVEGRGANFWSPGAVVAVGWATSAPMPLDGGSDSGVGLGRTALVGRGLIVPGRDRLMGIESTRRLVRGPQTVKVDVDGADRFAEVATAVYRFVVPDLVQDRVVDSADLVIDIPDSTVRADVWANDEWHPIRESRRDPAIVPLPEGALIANAVIVRLEGLFGMETRANDTELTIREADSQPS